MNLSFSALFTATISWKKAELLKAECGLSLDNRLFMLVSKQTNTILTGSRKHPLMFQTAVGEDVSLVPLTNES